MILCEFKPIFIHREKSCFCVGFFDTFTTRRYVNGRTLSRPRPACEGYNNRVFTLYDHERQRFFPGRKGAADLFPHLSFLVRQRSHHNDSRVLPSRSVGTWVDRGAGESSWSFISEPCQQTGRLSINQWIMTANSYMNKKTELKTWICSMERMCQFYIILLNPSIFSALCQKVN